MSTIKIKGSKLNGTIKTPPSKSMAHRAVICAALSKGVSRITNIEYSDDILATINAMRVLGADIIEKEDELLIDGTNVFNVSGGTIDCKESGSTLRFLVPISLVKENNINFIGEGNLGKRPLTLFYNIFDEQNISYSYEEGKLNLNINGRLSGGEFRVSGNISSQFISGLLFTLPLLKEDSRIIITTNLESKGYIDLTLSMLKRFGIEVVNKDYKEFIINGNQCYKSNDYEVEGDYSQGAFYLCAGALGSEVEVENLDIDSLQGDKEILDILEKLGAKLSYNNGKIRASQGNLKGCIIDGSQCPDIIPVVAVVCALSEGKTTIVNAERLRIKECDRLSAICSQLKILGANITERNDGLDIEGVVSLKGGRVSSFQDHRIAMALAIGATCAEGEVVIEDSQCVKKSYPGFWQDYKSLGGDIGEWNVGK